MKFEELLRVAGAEPVFETGLLLAGAVQRDDVERQLSRWVRSGRVVQLRRGSYALGPPYRRVEPHPFLVANRLEPGSYVSCQSALAWHGLIPESVPVVVSVAVCRPRRFETPLGVFAFRHVKTALLFGCRPETVAPGQEALVALPEKALLDWIHLEPRADGAPFLRELRLQHLETLDLERLNAFAERAGSPKLRRAARRIAELARIEQEEYESL